VANGHNAVKAFPLYLNVMQSDLANFGSSRHIQTQTQVA